MLHILWDINPIEATFLTQQHIIYDGGIIIVSSHLNLDLQESIWQEPSDTLLP